MSEWTLEQAAELVFEQVLDLLDGCDDDDVVRPGIVWRAINEAWAPQVETEPIEGLTAGELRARVARGRAALARGERVP